MIMETLLMRRFNQNAPRIVYYASEITSVTYILNNTLKQAIFIVPTLSYIFFLFSFMLLQCHFHFYVRGGKFREALTDDNEQM